MTTATKTYKTNRTWKVTIRTNGRIETFDIVAADRNEAWETIQDNVTSGHILSII